MFFHRKKDDLAKQGLVAALGLAGYMLLVAGVITNGSRWFGKEDGYFGPVLFLSLFGTSVLICGLIVLSGPYKLFVAKKGKEALMLIVWTTKWLAIFVLLVMARLVIW